MRFILSLVTFIGLLVPQFVFAGSGSGGFETYSVQDLLKSDIEQFLIKSESLRNKLIAMQLVQGKTIVVKRVVFTANKDCKMEYTADLINRINLRSGDVLMQKIPAINGVHQGVVVGEDRCDF